MRLKYPGLASEKMPSGKTRYRVRVEGNVKRWISLSVSPDEIMAILGHSEAKTSETYTRRVERWKLALGAMEKVNVHRSR